MLRLLLLLALTCVSIGCQSNVPLMNTPVDVVGKLTKAGKPVGNLTLTLQPLETGHMVPMKVGADGSFKGNIVPGKYAYFISANEDGGESALQGLDGSLKEANMQRTVTVQAGQANLEVTL